MRVAGTTQSIFPRARLVERLERVRPGSVVVITAAAGYGKTDLLQAWAQASQFPVAAVTAHPRHNTPHALTAALHRTLDDLGLGTNGVVVPANDSTASGQMGALIERLARHRVLLVLDDAHALTSPEALATVEELITHLPRSCVLVVASRTRPLFLTARLSLDGRLTHITADELLLTEQNVGAVAGLSSAQVSHALGVTGGWPAGFALLCRAWGARGAWGAWGPMSASGGLEDGERHVERAVEDTLLVDLDPAVVAFLRDAAVLGSADVDVLDVCRQTSDARRVVEGLRDSPLPMVTITGRELPTVTITGAMLSVLRRAATCDDSGRVRELLSTAAEAWESRWDVVAAHHALRRLGDTPRMVEFLTRVGPLVILEGRIQLVAEWLADFGGADVHTYPELPFLHSMVEGVSGNFEVTQRWIAMLENHQVSHIIQAQLAREVNLTTVARQTLNFTTVGVEVEQASTSASWWSIVSQMTMSTAAFARGDLDMAVGVLQMLEPFTRRTPLADSWRVALLALVLARAGRHDEAAGTLARWESLIDDHGLRVQPTTVGLDSAWAVYAVHAGDPVAAVAHSRAAMTKLRRLAPGIALHLLGVAAPLALALESVDPDAARELAALLLDLPLTTPEAPMLLPEVQALAERLQPTPAQLDDPGLSPAEAKVLARLATHLPVPKIAEELFLSPATVRTHAANTYRKLGVHSRSEAVAEAQRRGLLDRPS